MKEGDNVYFESKLTWIEHDFKDGTFNIHNPFWEDDEDGEHYWITVNENEISVSKIEN